MLWFLFVLVCVFIDCRSALQYTCKFYHGGMKVSTVKQEVSAASSTIWAFSDFKKQKSDQILKVM